MILNCSPTVNVLGKLQYMGFNCLYLSIQMSSLWFKLGADTISRGRRFHWSRSLWQKKNFLCLTALSHTTVSDSVHVVLHFPLLLSIFSSPCKILYTSIRPSLVKKRYVKILHVANQKLTVRTWISFSSGSIVARWVRPAEGTAKATRKIN